ncbi:MAG: glycosyltransferase family 2 protein [Alphaproteobacteria bacterium]|nr:glycosyltransferase family 2 protein [Alphaproteobacteria bacterium]
MSAPFSIPRPALDPDNDVAAGEVTCVPSQSPAFSIVMPAYNVADYIAEAIESVLAQTDPDWELFIIDDGSTDNLDAVLRAFTDARIRVVPQSHQGLSAARQNGLSRVRGEFVVVLDGDDRLRPDALAAFRRSFAAAVDIGLVFGRRALCGQDGQVIGAPLRWRWRRSMNGKVLRRVLAACPITSFGQAAFRRSVLARVGYYPSGDLGAGDWYFCVLLAAVTTFREVDDIVLDYRLRSDSLVRNWGRRAEASGTVNIDEFDPMIRRMYGTPEVRRTFGAGELRRLERRSRSQAYCVKGYECLRTRSWAPARRYLRRGLREYPFNMTALICLGLAHARWLPRFLRSAIGCEEPPAPGS